MRPATARPLTHAPTSFEPTLPVKTTLLLRPARQKHAGLNRGIPGSNVSYKLNPGCQESARSTR